MALRIAYFIQWLGDIFTLLLFIRAILSWIVRGYSSGTRTIYDLLVKITEPVVSPCRKLLNKFYDGPIDFSLFAAMIVIELAVRVIVTILLRVAY